MREVVDALGVDAREERHVVRRPPPREQPPQRDRVDDRAREQVRAGPRALVEHRDRHLAEPLGEPRRLLEQLAEADRAREARRPGADDEDADVDPLLGRSGGLGDRVRRAQRRRVVGRPRHQLLRARTSSVSFGTIWFRSPTTPMSQNSKMGAFGSLLTATIVPDDCMPTLCWIAPEMPQAM